jgi:hypothetical protein
VKNDTNFFTPEMGETYAVCMMNVPMGSLDRGIAEDWQLLIKPGRWNSTDSKVNLTACSANYVIERVVVLSPKDGKFDMMVKR